ncbi:MAG: hypothetical protein R3F56_13745 [Planctomycetota bacterium]
MRTVLLPTLSLLVAPLCAQGVVPPYQVSTTNPLPGLSVPAVPGTNVQQVHFVHLPSDPPNVFLCGLTVAGLGAGFGGAGGSDLLSGSYDVLTDTFTPNTEAAALNTTGTEFGLTIHHTGLYAVFDRLPGQPWLASRAAVGMPWSIVGQITALPGQAYYDPSLADYNGQTYLLHVLGTDIAMTPINLSNASLNGQPQVIINAARAGATANSPTPILDPAGQLIGVSHHDVLSSDNDHYMSMDFDPTTPAVLMNDTATWTNNGGFIGGRFFDAESSGVYHVFAIDTYWFTGGRGPVGGTMDIQAYTPPTSGSEIYFSFLLIGASHLPVALPIGAFGSLGIDISTLVTLPFPAHNNMNGQTQFTLAIPNLAFLRGRSLAAQSATLKSSTNEIRLGNTAGLHFD